MAIKKSFFCLLFVASFLMSVPALASDVFAASGVKAVQQQGVTITGVVSDASGMGMPGVSIRVKGATVGTVSNIDGGYTINVSDASSVLVFTFLGYKEQEIVVGNRSQIDVVLSEDAVAIREVVVTALGIKREEKALGYAMTELKGENLDANVINPIAALQGKAAGVEISGTDGGLFGSTKIQIRGASTLGNNNQPIYVVDGVILENNVHKNEVDFDGNSNDWGNELKNLNPADFESVSILKGAPATALYGSRGLNGAVVITTKGGGKYRGFGVSLTQSIGIDIVNTLPNIQTVYGPGARPGGVSYGEKDANGNYFKWDSNQFRLRDDGTPTMKYSGSSVHWGPKYDGREVELFDGSFGPYSANKNFYKDMFQTGLSTNTSVVVKGGTDKTSFYNSLGYRYSEGVIENNTFWRLSNLLKASHEISDKVKLSGSMTFAISKPKNPQLSAGEAVITDAVGPLYNPNYFKNKIWGDNHTGMASADYSDTYANVPLKNFWWNVFENSITQQETNVRPTLELDVKVTDWMNFRAEGNMNYYFSRRETKKLGTGFNNEGGEYELREEEKKQQTLAGTFTFNTRVKEFGVGGFARGEFYNYQNIYMRNKTEGGLIMPGQFFIGNSKSTPTVDSRIDGKKRMLSAIFAANLSWRDQYYLDITGRNDWSSSLVYRDGTGNYSYFYPSVSASWLISETLREQLPSWVSFMKVRGSWAQVGSDTDPFYIQQGYNLKRYDYIGGGSIYANEVPNILYQRDLKPERKSSWEIGLDWRFVNDRLGIDFTYYKENTKDQIMEIARAAESGVTSQLINAGNIQNSGVELALKTIPYRDKDWEFSLDFTYTRNRSKIVELHPDITDFVVLQGFVNSYNFRVASVAKVGGAYGLLMSDSNPMKDENGNHVLSWSDTYRAPYELRSGKAEEVGSIQPDFLGSIAPAVKYKNFSLRALFDFRYGGMIASYSNRYTMAYGLHENSLKYRDSENGGVTWTSQFADSKGMTFHDGYIPEGVFQKGTTVTTPSGTRQDVGGMTFQAAYEAGYVEPVHAASWHTYQNSWGQGVINDNWVSEVKYIALRELSFGYVVPKPFCQRLGIQGLNLSLSARNLGYLYNSLPNGLNPESVRGNTSGEFRERGFVPNTASYTFTVGLDF